MAISDNGRKNGDLLVGWPLSARAIRSTGWGYAPIFAFEVFCRCGQRLKVHRCEGGAAMRAQPDPGGA
jgi:hypothetical protein